MATFPDGSLREVQVNFCKNPACANFGVPASLKKHARRSSAGAATGSEYTISGAGAGLPLLKCRLCGEHLPMKSNQGIVEEIDRLNRFLLEPAEPTCPNVECVNHTVPVSMGKSHYYSKGKTDRGSQRYECRTCGKSFSTPCSPILRQRQPHKNNTLFKLLMGKMPLARICDALDIQFKTLYERIDFFHKQCQAFAARHERKLLRGMPIRRLYIAVDRQVYAVNWTRRKDKRNVVLQAIGSADLNTGYVFGMHLNFDGGLESDEIEADAIAAGDYSEQYPFRKHARLWLEGDYTKAVLETASRLSKKLKANATIGDDIAAAYSEAEARTDVEAPELITGVSKFPTKGMQVRTEYTLYAHFYWLRQLFRGVDKVRFYLDQESGIRAACLSAFEQEIRENRCEAFYVRLAKEITVDEKRKIIAASRSAFEEAKESHPELSEDEVKVLLMRDEINRAATIGKWSDRWVAHPFPNSSEPNKAICWITSRQWREGFDLEPTQEEFDNHMARLHLKASLHAIDRFFMQIRRRLSLLERPIGTSSKAGRTWYGYSAYNPENIVRLLDIFRVYYNYCLPDKNGKTAAMRIGLTERQLEPKDIIQFRA